MLTVALTYDANFEATIAVNDSVVGTVSKTPYLDDYTVAEEAMWDFPLSGTRNGTNIVTITQTAGEGLRLDYLSLRLSEPKPLPDLQSAALPSQTVARSAVCSVAIARICLSYHQSGSSCR